MNGTCQVAATCCYDDVRHSGVQVRPGDEKSWRERRERGASPSSSRPTTPHARPVGQKRTPSRSRSSGSALRLLVRFWHTRQRLADTCLRGANFDHFPSVLRALRTPEMIGTFADVMFEQMERLSWFSDGQRMLLNFQCFPRCYSWPELSHHDALGTGKLFKLGLFGPKVSL